jgi:hypothetical protein
MTWFHIFKSPLVLDSKQRYFGLEDVDFQRVAVIEEQRK